MIEMTSILKSLALSTLLISANSYAGWMVTSQRSSIEIRKKYDGVSVACIEAPSFDLFGPLWKRDQERMGKTNGNRCHIDFAEKAIYCRDSGETISATIWFEDKKKCEDKRKDLEARISLPAAVNPSMPQLSCKSIKFDDLKILETEFVRKGVDEGAPSAKSYPEKITLLCAQVRCVVESNSLTFEKFKKRALSESNLASGNEALVEEAIDSLELSKCVKTGKKGK